MNNIVNHGLRCLSFDVAHGRSRKVEVINIDRGHRKYNVFESCSEGEGEALDPIKLV